MRNVLPSGPGPTAALAVLLAMPATLAAQATGAGAFDFNRFSNAGHDWFHTFYPTGTEPLAEAIGNEKVNADHWVLVTDTADGRLALLMDQMAYHHIAEGTSSNGEHWMATF